MDNGGQWTMMDIGQWWTMDNGVQWTMFDNGGHWTMVNNSLTCCKWYEMVPNGAQGVKNGFKSINLNGSK